MERRSPPKRPILGDTPKSQHAEAFENEGRIFTTTRGGRRFLECNIWTNLPGEALCNDHLDSDVSIYTHGSSSERFGIQDPKTVWPCLNVSSKPPPTRVTWCWTPSAAAARPSPPPRSSTASWIGIDITHLAVALMKNRLKTAFNIIPGPDYRVVGEPVDVGGARALAEQDRYQFEFWAMSLLEAFPREQKKKGADQGIDGVVYFIDGPRRAVNKAIVQVKSGRVSSPQIRDLVGTVEREKAAMGLFITLEEPTRDMRMEAVSAGFYHSDVWQRDYPRLQIRTIGELLEGRAFDIPYHPSDVPVGAAGAPARRGSSRAWTRPRRGVRGRLKGAAGPFLCYAHFPVMPVKTGIQG